VRLPALSKTVLALRSLHTKERPEHVLQRLVLVNGRVARGIYADTPKFEKFWKSARGRERKLSKLLE